LNDKPDTDENPSWLLFLSAVKKCPNERQNKKKELPRLADDIIAKPQI